MLEKIFGKMEIKLNTQINLTKIFLIKFKEKVCINTGKCTVLRA